jgi:hypothetical protein
MSPIALTQQGAYPLLGVGKLVNVGVAFPGEVWSNKRASGIIIPGSLIRESSAAAEEEFIDPATGETVKRVAEAGEGSWVPVKTGDTIAVEGAGIRRETLGVAMRQIMVPDVNPGSQYNPQLGPNEIMNLPIASGDWLRCYMSGVLNMTLVVPDASYKEGDVIGWAPKGERPVGKAEGSGAWAKIATTKENKILKEEAPCIAHTDLFVVHKAPVFYGSAGECVLTLRYLRTNV